MAPRARHIPTLVLLFAALVWPAARAQAQAPRRATTAPRRSAVVVSPVEQTAPPRQREVVPAPTPDHEQPEILRSLPHPPAEPGSLFDDVPPLGAPAPDLEHPYFERDPLLDPVDWPEPGWFADAEVGIIKPYVNFPAVEQVTNGLRGPVLVQLGTAHLNWVAAPRVEVGYRLPSGFGEFTLSDRYFNAYGSDTPLGPNGPQSRRTEFMLNYTDIDYASRELTPYNGWSIKFRGGVRIAENFLGTRVDEPLAQAAAGNGVFAQRQTNRNTSVGPHFGVQIDRRFARRGLIWSSMVDVAEQFTRVRQETYAATTLLTPTGGFASSDVVSHFLQEVPVLTAQIGLSWQPPRLPNSRLYVGYFAQFWYLFGTNSNITPVFLKPVYTSFQNEGIILQWNFNH